MSMNCARTCQLCYTNCPEIHIAHGNTDPKGPLSPGSFVAIVCDEGYVYTGNGYIQCTRTGIYNTEIGECRRNYCDKPDLLYGSVNVDEGVIETGRWVHVTCDIEYKYSLTSNYHYCTYGSMILDPPLGDCSPEVRDCDSINIPNGYLLPSGIIQSETWAEIVCHDGFQYSGDNTYVFCTRTGVFSSDIAECVSVMETCAFPRALNGRVYSSSGSEELHTGDSITISCNNGYSYSEKYSSHICTNTGSLSPPIGSCQPNRSKVSCASIRIPNSYPTLETRVNSWVEMRCKHGYKYSKNSPWHFCGSNGDYHPNLGECLGEEDNSSGGYISCQKPEIPNANLKYTLPLTPGNVLEVSCEAGYEYSLPRNFHLCLNTGNFDPHLGRCHRLPGCILEGVANGIVDRTGYVPIGTVVEVSCNKGFSYSRLIPIHLCGLNDQLEVPLGTCDPGHCPSVTVPNAIVVPATQAEVAKRIHVICLRGFRYHGDRNSFTCLTSLQYDRPIGRCVLTSSTSEDFQNKIIDIGEVTKEITDNPEIESNESDYDVVDASVSPQERVSIKSFTDSNETFKNISSAASTPETESKNTDNETVAVTDDKNVTISENVTDEKNVTISKYATNEKNITISENVTDGISMDSFGKETTSKVYTDDSIITDGITNSGSAITNTTVTKAPSGQLTYCPSLLIDKGPYIVAGTVRATNSVNVSCEKGYVYDKIPAVAVCSTNGSWTNIGSCLDESM